MLARDKAPASEAIRFH
uniref:Uncharacterized protein n=1 Tax=Arundo donax TaxID=35708 RepID=A0A0A8ZGI3_ARUDO